VHHQRSREVRQRREGKARVNAHPSRGHLLKGKGAGVLIHLWHQIFTSAPPGTLTWKKFCIMRSGVDLRIYIFYKLADVLLV